MTYSGAGYTINDRPSEVRRIFNERAEQLCISSVSLAELHYGAAKSELPARSPSVAESFAAPLEVLPFEEKAAVHYGEIRAALERAGIPIGPYDLMIAGHARSQGPTLVTNNTREFERVDGLRTENWAGREARRP